MPKGRDVPRSQAKVADRLRLVWPRSIQKVPAKPTKLPLTELGPGLYLIDNVLTLDECHALIQQARPLMEPTNPGNKPPKKGQAFRNNHRCEVTDPNFAKEWFASLSATLEEIQRDDGARPVAFNPSVRVYSYAKGQSFGPHVDEPVRLGDLESEFTLLLYLTGGPRDPQKPPLRGGCTRFLLPGKGRDCNTMAVEPEAGRALLHWTGHDFLHEGALVMSGEKFVLRTDVLFPRQRAP
eukprot:GGOE01014524.1.p1 GENE.GGOE01014524.1~~GGOE01014524.1.p1  ORF type:complete len:253 (+),score=41.99 GGOE01014524.1:48-761(+)